MVNMPPLVSVFTGLYIAVKSFITVVVLTQQVYCVAVLPCFMFQEPRALFLFRKRSDTFTNTAYIWAVNTTNKQTGVYNDYLPRSREPKSTGDY